MDGGHGGEEGGSQMTPGGGLAPPPLLFYIWKHQYTSFSRQQEISHLSHCTRLVSTWLHADTQMQLHFAVEDIIMALV